MATRVLLLADDLTGACDAAVHFAMRGLPTAVAISLDADHPDVPVCAINLESRDREPAQIAPLMKRAAAAAPFSPDTVIFKKIDSVFRGRPGIEAVEAMKAFACDRAVFTPALPALGRVVEKGILRVCDDPDFAPLDVAASLRSEGVNLSVSDAVCDADLDRIVAEALASGRRTLWAGSAGLAAALARALPRGTETAMPAHTPGPAIFAIGSTHPSTLAQIEALRASRREHVLIPIPRGVLTPADVRDLLAGASRTALVLSGGDTASSVCRALGATWIELASEIIPGVPYGVLRGGPAEGMRVATKSGGFGAPDALIQVADFFQCPKN
jgi:uncharacterized protein YgbK (DUF1537 family)